MSRRSSHSTTKSAKYPTWRSHVSVSKNSSPAGPSLSFVVAEPEQGAPLASATTKLPVQKAPQVAIDGLPTVSLNDYEDRWNAQPLSPGQSRGRAVDVKSEEKVSRSSISGASSSSSPPPPCISVPSKQLTPTNNPDPTPTPKAVLQESLSPSSVGGTSWFSTITKRSKGARRPPPTASSPVTVPATSLIAPDLQRLDSPCTDNSQPTRQLISSPSYIRNSDSGSIEQQRHSNLTTSSATPIPPHIDIDTPKANDFTFPPTTEDAKSQQYIPTVGNNALPIHGDLTPTIIFNIEPSSDAITHSTPLSTLASTSIPSSPPPENDSKPLEETNSSQPEPQITSERDTLGNSEPKRTSPPPANGSYLLGFSLFRWSSSTTSGPSVDTRLDEKDVNDGMQHTEQGTSRESVTQAAATIDPDISGGRDSQADHVKIPVPSSTSSQQHIPSPTNSTEDQPTAFVSNNTTNTTETGTISPAPVTSISTAVVSTETAEGEENALFSEPSHASPSWWDYLGWKSAPPLADPSSTPSTHQGSNTAGTIPSDDMKCKNITASTTASDAEETTMITTPSSPQSDMKIDMDIRNRSVGAVTPVLKSGKEGLKGCGKNGAGNGKNMSDGNGEKGGQNNGPAEMPTLTSSSSGEAGIPSMSTSMSVGTEAVGRISGNSGSGGSRSVESNAGGTVAGSIEVKKGQVTHQEVDQAQSLTEERVSGRNGSAWYNPWAWYGCSSVDPKNIGVSADTDVIVEEIKDRPLSGDDADEKTANVGAEGSQSIESSPLPLPQERKEDETVATATSGSVASIDVNPISASIETHRYGWASFFASTVSRTLVVKSITAAPESACEPVKVDENGIEVMDIDDGDVPGVPEPQEQQQERKQQVKVKEKITKPVGSQEEGNNRGRSLVATLVRGRGKTHSNRGKAHDGSLDSDTASIRSAAPRQTASMKDGVTGAVVSSGEVHGIPIPPVASQNDTVAVASVSSSPASSSTKMSVAKKASLVLGSSGSGDTNSGKNTKKPASEPVLPARSAAGASSSKKQPIGRAASPSPNLVLPSWQDTFHTAPRNVVPKTEASKLVKTMQYVSGMLFSGNREAWSAGNDKGKQKAIQEREREILFPHFGKALPKAWDVVENAYSVPLKDRGSAKSGVKLDKDVLRGCRKVVVIGVHGWFPGAVMRTVLGEPTGTSSKFVNMMTQALEDFQTEHGVKLEKVTKIPLEGEGTIKRRVEKLYTNLLANQEWIDDIHSADAILVATHSQGSIVTTHLLNCLIQDKHIRTSRNSIVAGPTGSFPAGVGMDIAPAPIPQRVCCLALCGIHLGPLRYLSTNSLFQPYFQYIESPAARELFEFQNTENEVSKEYVQALGNVLNNGTKMLYVASLNDQVVPIYSGLFTAASHPLILRALYIDGDAYHSSDFLANILVLLLRILNSGIPDSGLLVHLSEATAGSLNGVGHSTAYEEIATYALAVKYLFMTNNGLEEHPELALEPFNARQEQNDYEIPWALRDVIADERVRHFFGQEISQLRDAFREWHPRTSILRDLKRKLQPIQRLPPSFTTGTINKL